MSKNYEQEIFCDLDATFAGYNIYQSQRTVIMSDLALANVEALANGETPSQIVCISSGSVDCPIMSDKVKYVSQGYGFMY
ncbi:NVEALA domain-containing protein [Bacteroides sp.]|uniref:NVEALA domain-containing protein n=1 Tax=Bacteroides sp. TaxID=29523 RepID=UPI002FC6771C